MHRIKVTVAIAFAFAACIASADMSFWGTGSPVTNRAPSAVAAASIPEFSSCMFFYISQILSPFYSTDSGLMLFVR